MFAMHLRLRGGALVDERGRDCTELEGTLPRLFLRPQSPPRAHNATCNGSPGVLHPFLSAQREPRSKTASSPVALDHTRFMEGFDFTTGRKLRICWLTLN